MLLFCKNLILLKNLCQHKLLYSLRLRYSNLIKSRAKVIPKICSVLYRSYATLVSSAFFFGSYIISVILHADVLKKIVENESACVS